MMQDEDAGDEASEDSVVVNNSVSEEAEVQGTVPQLRSRDAAFKASKIVRPSQLRIPTVSSDHQPAVDKDRGPSPVGGAAARKGFTPTNRTQRLAKASLGSLALPGLFKPPPSLDMVDDPFTSPPFNLTAHRVFGAQDESASLISGAPAENRFVCVCPLKCTVVCWPNDIQNLLTLGSLNFSPTT